MAARCPRRGVELSDDARFAARIVRLAATSLIVLGVVWRLAAGLTAAPAWVGPALLAGWLLMPTVLLLSLRTPSLRYALTVPSLLVGGALLGVCATALPSTPAAATGWRLLTLGIWFGGVLGLWFWFRLAPVPAALDDPFAPGRWALVAAHVGLVVVGLGLALLG